MGCLGTVLTLWILLRYLVICDIVTEYCDDERVDAACSQSEMIMIQSAIFNQPSSGKCLGRMDLSALCGSDVTEVLHRKCSGRRACDIAVQEVSDEAGQQIPCHEGLAHQLKVVYICVKVATCNRATCEWPNFAHVSSFPGFISSDVAWETGCGSASCPWVLQARAGQKVNLTLYDFSASSLMEGTDDLCVHYASVAEEGRDTAQNITLCQRDSAISRHVYLSEGNIIKVQFYKLSSRDGHRYFAMKYEGFWPSAQLHAPYFVQASQIWPGQVQVVWSYDDVRGTMFTVNYAPKSSEDWQTYSISEAYVATLSNLRAETNYSIKVTAQKGAGAMTSNTASVYVREGLPWTPVNLTLKFYNGSRHNAFISWKRPRTDPYIISGVEEYHIEIIMTNETLTATTPQTFYYLERVNVPREDKFVVQVYPVNKLGKGRPVVLQVDAETTDMLTSTRANTSLHTLIDRYQKEVISALSCLQVTMEDVLQEQATQRKLLTKLLHKSASGQPHEVLEGISLPLRSQADIDALEERLKDKAVMQTLIGQLALSGGTDLRQAVRRAMQDAMTHEAELHFNWSGVTGPKGDQTVRQAFSSLKLSRAVRDAVMKNPLVTEDAVAVEREIARYLRGKGDCGGKRKERMLKRKDQQQAQLEDNVEQTDQESTGDTDIE